MDDKIKEINRKKQYDLVELQKLVLENKCPITGHQ
jgi:hypothetical protein